MRVPEDIGDAEVCVDIVSTNEQAIPLECFTSEISGGATGTYIVMLCAATFANS